MMRKLNHNFVDHDRRPVLPGCGVAELRTELADHPMLKTIHPMAQRNWDSRNITGISASVILVKPCVLAPVQRSRKYPTDRRTVSQKTDFEMNTRKCP